MPSSPTVHPHDRPVTLTGAARRTRGASRTKATPAGWQHGCDEHRRSRRFAVTVPHLRVTRCQICRRTSPAGPGPSARSGPGTTAGSSRSARPPVLVAGRGARRCPQMPPLACAGPGRTCHRAWPEDAGGHGGAGSAMQAAMPTAFLPSPQAGRLARQSGGLPYATNHASDQQRAPVRRRDPVIVLGTTRCSARELPLARRTARRLGRTHHRSAAAA
jgi:hypothetical protein